MLLGAIVFALVAFLAFVAFVGTAKVIWLYVLFGSAIVGLVLFVLDWKEKHRASRVSGHDVEVDD
ncbi:zinc-binding dehydrogenase [Corynebacterium incognita]|uniref:Zinc-binding dehydrogenase n=2 Tax=Corynebacterium incognita TaxID=2754725 RepID=A0A7G7CS83_9CORY|nr:zinc-binding dehydrogenase [Corynebacterium incognita]